jgi:hypothetical protein
MTWAEKIHTAQWYCDLCGDNPLEFDEKESFVAHLNTRHGNQLTKSKLDGRARRNRRIATREPFVCPICGCVPDGVEPLAKETLWNHIAAHLKSIAFLSLSYVDDDLGDRETLVEPLENDKKDDETISRTSLRNQTLESFDDIPTTDVLENGIRRVDGQEFPDEPSLLNPQRTREFELVRWEVQGLMSVANDVEEPSEERRLGFKGEGHLPKENKVEALPEPEPPVEELPRTTKKLFYPG